MQTIISIFVLLKVWHANVLLDYYHSICRLFLLWWKQSMHQHWEGY